MKPRVTLRRALEDPELLGAALAGPSWHAWRSLLLAAMGEPLQPDELEAFTRFTGRSTPPSERVDELWCCVGRRGGKSRAMSTLAVYLAGLCDYSDKLARGERGVVLLLAPDIRGLAFAYRQIERRGTHWRRFQRSQCLGAAHKQPSLLRIAFVVALLSASEVVGGKSLRPGMACRAKST